ncbi:hypothetical protein FNF27_04911 [Cafeteria roenbergensis]|uniref:Uncharacterized protein n=1 Tax=Cafeteria roenbergensis TaxID=33653 RepID=A0A5A8E707_CAFRO|nr:hypothetical protein FNF29_06397 [Cafeteria roenbergensis]KAA0173575.1 hypothetical protein FNF27_04911 [Cafeteria roenbergensis]|eukprot:KAA0148924.1 hypothetical protein FNF29_06397 [Cafeteria roenbergensis]
MGACMSTEAARRKVIVVGLEGAGKSSLALVVERPGAFTKAPATIPSGQVSVVNREYRGLRFTFWDLGGGAPLRPYWRHHFVGAQAVVFVVDASAPDMLDEAREALRACATDDQLSWPPFCVLVNKADAPGAMALSDVTAALEVDEILGESRQWTAISTSTATDPPKGIQQCMDWLVENTKPL